MGLKDRLCRYWFPEAVAANGIRHFATVSGIVLMYHEVMPDDIPFAAWTVVRESDFRWQMSYIQSHFDVVTMDEALKRISGKHQKAKPFAVVTFDDGYKGNLDTVLPIMKSMELPFTVYVATQAIIEGHLYWHDRIINLLCTSNDINVTLVVKEQTEHFMIEGRTQGQRRWKEVQRLLTRLKQMVPLDRDNNVSRIVGESDRVEPWLRMLSPENLQHLARSGYVTIGAHTHRHELLDQLDPADIWETLQTANTNITEITGCIPKHFAYPNGNYNQCVKNVVRDAGYATAVTTMSGIWRNGDCSLAIPRIGIGGFDSKGHFKARISGFL